MNDDVDRLDSAKRSAALKRLADHLTALDSQGEMDFSTESDMLSLIISGTLNGDNVQERYPAFYRKLLENSALRDAFLDALDSLEAEQTGQQIPMPGGASHALPFATTPSLSIVQANDENDWHASLERSLEQLRAIFSPQQLVYRADSELLEDPWFTLVREEIRVVDTKLDVVVECTPSTESENMLAAFLNLAMIVETPTHPVHFPLRASLEWGTYHHSILVQQEGRVRFPDIPLSAIFDLQRSEIRAGLNLVLETLA